MKFEIVNCTEQDVAYIFSLYDAAIVLQKTKFNLHWQPFQRDLIEQEIRELRQWKILADGATAGIFATTGSDPEIWGERDADAAIYLHRIVTDPAFRGNNLVGVIVEWAKHYALINNLAYIRLDTWAGNQRLTTYYKKYGFVHLGNITLRNTQSLPKHYEGNALALFQIIVKDVNKEIQRFPDLL